MSVHLFLLQECMDNPYLPRRFTHLDGSNDELLQNDYYWCRMDWTAGSCLDVSVGRTAGECLDVSVDQFQRMQVVNTPDCLEQKARADCPPELDVVELQQLAQVAALVKLGRDEQKLASDVGADVP